MNDSLWDKAKTTREIYDDYCQVILNYGLYEETKIKNPDKKWVSFEEAEADHELQRRFYEERIAGIIKASDLQEIAHKEDHAKNKELEKENKELREKLKRIRELLEDFPSSDDIGVEFDDGTETLEYYEKGDVDFWLKDLDFIISHSISEIDAKKNEWVKLLRKEASKT